MTWQQGLAGAAAAATALAVYMGTISDPSETVEAITIVVGGIAVVLNAVNVALSTPTRMLTSLVKREPLQVPMQAASIAARETGTL